MPALLLGEVGSDPIEDRLTLDAVRIARRASLRTFRSVLEAWQVFP